MFFETISIIWGVLLWSFLLASLFVVIFIALHYVEKFVQTIFPNFMCSEQEIEERRSRVSDKQERKLIALDFIMQERIRRQAAVRRRYTARVEGRKAGPLISKGSFLKAVIPDEVSISEIGPSVRNLEALKALRQEDHQALYMLVRMIDGKKRYLCRKSSRRVNGEIQNAHIFAALPQEAIRMDRGAIARLLVVIPDSIMEPANAYARMIERIYGTTPEIEPEQQPPAQVKELLQ